MSETARRRWAFTLTSASVGWALALVTAAFLLPVYGTETTELLVRPGGTHVIAVQHQSATLVAVNGASLRLLILLVLPAALAVIAWTGLHQLCTRGRISGRRVAPLAILVLAALTLLTGFSTGGEMLPVLAPLVIGRRLTPIGSARPGF